MFIRFVVGADSDDHRWLTGVITHAMLLRDAGQLDEHEAEWLEETYEWLNEHLPRLPFSSSGWSRDAVSWFKDGAGESIERVWGIVSLLRKHGLAVRLLKSHNPGKILYEDRLQVVVEEWKRIEQSPRRRSGRVLELSEPSPVGHGRALDALRPLGACCGDRPACVHSVALYAAASSRRARRFT